MAGKKAHLKLSVAQHRALLKALKGGELGDVQSLEDIKLYVEPGQFGGKGLWSDLKSVVAKAQKSPLVQDLEKKAIHKGSEALQKFATKHAEGIGDLAAETIGLPKGMADSAIKRSVSSIAAKGEKWADDKISGSGIRYMSPAGGGMRMSGTGTYSGSGMRLSGQGHGRAHHCGCGLRLAGSGITASHTFPAYPLEHGETP